MDIEIVNIVLGVAVVSLLCYFIWKKMTSGSDNKQPGGEEYFYYANGVNQCNSSTEKLCKDMKKRNPVFGEPGLLYNMMENCGGSAYPDVQDCYPEWATIRGGTEKANIDLILKQVTNKMY